jgi:site-specific recombinase XerD
MKRGRKRRFSPAIPAHIDQEKLPDYCYWDKDKKHWYAIQYTDSKPTRKRIAGKGATLAELHAIMEQLAGVERDTFKWLSGLFKASKTFQGFAKKTKANYQGSEKIIIRHPTKINQPLGSIPLRLWSNKLVQKLVDKVEVERGPTAANHCLKYARRVFRWGKNRGYCTDNPAIGIEPAVERKLRRLPDKQVLIRLVEEAKQRGAMTTRTKGSCAPYLWCVLEIGYQCRLRGIETNSLTDADLLPEGILCNRTKGSLTNITKWNQRLRAAVDALIARRQAIRDKKKLPIPAKPEERHLFVNEGGSHLAKSSLDSSWKRFIRLMLSEGAIEESQRFGLHDLKRRGTTDTQGTRADKQEAAGWKDADMVDIYDFSIPVVKPVSD